MSEEEFKKYRESYISVLEKLFFPPEPAKNDIIKYFSSLLRVTGMEDSGWDPYAESKGLLNDINNIFKLELPAEHFPEPGLTTWRMGLFMYSHILEMDAPYEVITNLMRYQLGHGYSPNPYYKFLNKDGRKKFKRYGLSPLDKIEIIKKLDKELKTGVGDIFDEFYNADLRNAISHADFVLTDSQFRVRNDRSLGAFTINLEELDKTLTKAKAYIASIFELDYAARQAWGRDFGNKGIPYDPVYKGLMEVLVDDAGLMCGFKVHWPNHSESFYKRTDKGISMVNCWVMPEKGSISLSVDLYARNKSNFSPLVEQGEEPRYTNLSTGEKLHWPESV